MVSSLDGSIVFDGASAGLSSDNDTEVLLTLRRLADVIIVGAGTVRAEGYGAPKKAGQRIGVVTASGDVDVSSPLFTSGAGFLICTDDTPDRGVEAMRRRVPDRSRTGVDRLDELVPGVGVRAGRGWEPVERRAARAGLVDELHLTVSPQMVGGNGAAAGRRARRRHGVRPRPPRHRRPVVRVQPLGAPRAHRRDRGVSRRA
jgi:riboflavin biosynthesis pyrimidine reductase